MIGSDKIKKNGPRAFLQMYKKTQNSLRLKILSGFLLITSFVILYLSIFIIPDAFEKNKKWLEEILTKDVTRVSETLVPYLLQDNIASSWDMLNNLQEQEPDWVVVELYNKNGDLIFPLTKAEEHVGEKMLIVDKQINFYSEELGKLHTVINIEKPLNDLNNILYIVMATIGIAFVGGGVLFFWLIEKVVTKPVMELSEATRQMKVGDFSYKLPTLGNDEIGDLLLNFRDMRREIKSSQAKLLHALQKAEEANVSKTEFISTMSHELRTPLTVIMGYTPLLARTDVLPSVKKFLQTVEDDNANVESLKAGMKEVTDEISHYVSRIDVSSNHLLGLINDVLDVARIESGNLKLELQPISVKSLVDFTLGQFKQTALNKKIELKSNIVDGDIFADETRIKQILINLVGNAMKFTDTGHVTISTLKKKDHMQFEIEDTGIGISKSELPTVFEKFMQADGSSTRKFGGTGLGLAITKQLIEMHNGEITASSKLGEGSKFTFKIPTKP